MPAHDGGATHCGGRRTKTSKGGNRGLGRCRPRSIFGRAATPRPWRDLWSAGAARRQMQPKAAHVFRFSRVRRADEERRKILDPLYIVVLGLRRELADRHVFDHAPAQRAHRLVGEGDVAVLSESC
jgi:hypothetical protein